MIRKAVLKIAIIVVLIMSVPVTVYAQNIKKSDEVVVLDTLIKNVEFKENISRIWGSARGRILSSAGLGISNDKDGVIGVYAETLCHESVEKINLIIYLEVWDEVSQDWEYVCDYSFQWLASDNPSGNLTDVSVSFDIPGLYKGKTYSLRAYHTATSFEHLSEMMSTETAGIVLK